MNPFNRGSSMRPFLINIGITASHFFLLALVWFVTNRFLPQGLFLILGTYLLLGPLPYLYQASARQRLRLRRINLPTLIFTYFLGLGILLITLSFVYQCRIQVLKISIPLIVNDPPWMATLLASYIGTAGFLSYLTALLSDLRVPQNRPKALLASPPVLNPLLKGVLLRDAQPQPSFSSALGGSGGPATSPDPGSARPMERPLETESVHPRSSFSDHADEDKNQLTTNPSKTINRQLYSTGQPRGLTPLEPLEVSRLKQIQEAFSALTGLSLFTYDTQGTPVCEPSLENPICRVIQKTPKGLEHCKSHCGKSIGRALQSREPVFFKCDVGLHVFSIPMILKDRDDKSNMVFLGGKTFFTPEEFSVCREGSKQLDVPPEELSRLSDEIRVVDHHLMVSAARFLESVLPYLFATLNEKNLTASKLARLLTLFTLTSEFKEERPFKHLAPSLLNTLGILFGLHTASVMVLDPRERRFKPEAVFGQKANLIAASSMESASGLVGILQEKASPVQSRDTLEILKTGLPAEIVSLHLFPLLVRNDHITGILAIFDTPLTEEEIGIIRAFCQQFAICQENRGLREQHRDMAKDVSMLLEIAKTVGSALDSEDLFGIILEKSTEFLEAEQGSLMLLDEDRRELTVKAMKGLNKKIVELLKIQPGEGISGKVLATGTPLIVSDIESDERIAQEKRPRYKTKSFISIPLKLNDRTIGVLNIADKITGEVFREEDLRLLISIGAYASVAIERSKFYHKTEELKKISITDSLTGLLNRRYFRERMAEEIERSRRHHLPLSLIMMDIDNFKSVNDTYGHLVGDEALKITARAIRNCVRTIDVAARYGGEEFTVILPQTAKSDATVIAERICSEVSRLDFPFEQAARKLSFSVSLGLATFPDDAEALDDLVRNTDIALYRAKAQGKNRVVIYNKREEQG